MDTITQALILAGGQATRMRPYTDDAPKAMVPVAGKPIIGHQLAWLAEHGIKHVMISAGYRSEMIREYVMDGADFGVSVEYAIEAEPLGRGGGLKFAAKRLSLTGPFLVLNGDVIADFAITELADHHDNRGNAVTIALVPYRSNWGIAQLDEHDRISGFTQSPQLPYWINAGIYVFNADVVALLPDLGDHEDTTFPHLAAEGRLGGYRVTGYWRGIDTVKDVMTASEELTKDDQRP